MLVVCCLNALGVCLTAAALFDDTLDRASALVILGDAQESFLRNPDKDTRGLCLLTLSDVDEQLKTRSQWVATTDAKEWSFRAYRRWETVGAWGYMLTLIM